MNQYQQGQPLPLSHYFKKNDKYWHDLISWLHPEEGTIDDYTVICNKYGSDSIYGKRVVVPCDFDDDYEVNTAITLADFNS